ncbi:MAG: hypothetical protein KBC05_14900 [Candidatus Hydrogenedentes bacterium]|nr:hypothetical protein [Candidatus Hydrogenedentota bacterium]
MKKLIALAIVLSAASAMAQQVTTPMQVDDAGRLVVPNKSAWQDANGMAARDRANLFTAANTFELQPAFPLLPGRVLVGNASSNATAVAVSGDLTVSNAGAATIANGAVTIAKTAAATQAVLSRLPTVSETTQTVTLRGDAAIAVTDGAGAAIAEAALVRVWISTTDGGAPSATDNTVAVTTGTSIQAVTANAHYLILTDATGDAAITVTVAGAGDRYVMVECGGRVASAKLEIAVIE